MKFFSRFSIYAKLVVDKTISCVLLELFLISNYLFVIGGTTSAVKKLLIIILKMQKYMLMLLLLQTVQVRLLEFSEARISARKKLRKMRMSLGLPMKMQILA